MKEVKEGRKDDKQGRKEGRMTSKEGRKEGWQARKEGRKEGRTYFPAHSRMKVSISMECPMKSFRSLA